MIAYIRGELVEKAPTRVVLEAAGVGYELAIPLSTYDRLPATGETVKLLAWHAVREDDESLYGFASVAEREMFASLVGVSGVGPKIALAMLSGLTVGELALSIASGNAKRLSAIKGVGKKTAEKICVDLRDKVNALEALAATSSNREKGAANPMLRDTILAMTSLGFGEEIATKMVSEAFAAHPEAEDAQTLVRYALAVGRR